jgi:hypothetical protein
MSVCARCGREYENPVPSVTNPEGNITEIAASEWCSDCNRIAMMAVFRQSSVYFKKGATDPLKGGQDASA